jgi:small-conductance mechanosensitive channel
MGEKGDHLKKLSALSEKIMNLANSLKQAERDMESTWIDDIEARDLRNVKEQMKAAEEALCALQEEIGHVETEHCQKAMGTD